MCLELGIALGHKLATLMVSKCHHSDNNGCPFQPVQSQEHIHSESAKEHRVTCYKTLDKRDKVEAKSLPYTTVSW